MKRLGILLLPILLTYSCETTFESGGIGLERDTSTFAVYVTTNRQDGSGFLVPFDGLPTGEIDVSENFEKGILLNNTRFTGMGFDGAVYHPSNPLGAPGIQRLLLDTDGRFVEDGFIGIGNLSLGGGQIFGFATPNKGYYSDHSLSQTAVQIFNPKTMERLGDIDCSQAIEAVRANIENADRIESTSIGGFMVERDGKFFTQLFFNDENNFQVDDKTYVLVIDVASDTVENITVWDDHIKIGYFSCVNCNYVNTDEQGDLYLGSFIGNFIDPEGPNFRVVRIRRGETEFDQTWDLNGKRGDFPNGETFALGGAIQNSKMYVKMMAIPVDPTFAALSEKEYYAYEIDLDTRNATIIEDIPVGYWRSIHGPAVYGGMPYFVVENDDVGKAYYYSYDPETASSQLQLTIVGGQPQNIVEF